MGTCSRIATMIDADMLYRNGATIASAWTPDSSLVQSLKSGRDVSKELGNRYLLRNLLPFQVAFFEDGSKTPRFPKMPDRFKNAYHYVTPTPFSPEEAIAWLALPTPHQLRPYVVLLDPKKINDKIIGGPRWVRMGGGIEYVLVRFPDEAIVDIGAAAGAQWPLLIT